MSSLPDPSPPTPLPSRLASKLIIPLTAVFLASLAVWSIITPNFLENQYAELPPDPYGLSPSERLGANGRYLPTLVGFFDKIKVADPRFV